MSNGQIMQFTGSFKADETVAVDAEALRQLLNAFLSQQEHQVMELFVLQRSANLPVNILANNLRQYIKDRPVKFYEGQIVTRKDEQPFVVELNNGEKREYRDLVLVALAPMLFCTPYYHEQDATGFMLTDEAITFDDLASTGSAISAEDLAHLQSQRHDFLMKEMEANQQSGTSDRE